MAKMIVTDGAGMIGSNLLKLLIKQGNNVKVKKLKINIY